MLLSDTLKKQYREQQLNFFFFDMVSLVLTVI